MRLIDADDVNNHIVGYVDLRDCPTVEAIPIEWIKHYKSIYGLTYSTLFNLLGTMLKDWEGKNGKV